MIAERIHSARRDAGLSQAELAKRIVEAAASDGEDLSLDRSAVARWEAAIFEPALRYRRYIARVLDRDRREMFPTVAAHEAA
jgi:transcriptional regulator with XRE-family HTH domain